MQSLLNRFCSFNIIMKGQYHYFFSGTVFWKIYVKFHFCFSIWHFHNKGGTRRISKKGMAALDISLEGESCPLHHLHFYVNTEIKQQNVFKQDEVFPALTEWEDRVKNSTLSHTDRHTHTHRVTSWASCRSQKAC